MTAKNNGTAKTKVRLISEEPKKPKIKLLVPLYAIGRYLKGSWKELRQVRWPNRRATWGLTAAVILFTVFFVVMIILLDFGFSQLFKLVIK